MFAPAKTLSVLFSAAALTGLAGTASASEFQSNGRTFEVRYTDLDLSQKAGQKELDRRIARAAKTVCTNDDAGVAAKCRALAIAHVKQPIATAVARAQSGERYAEAGRVGR